MQTPAQQIDENNVVAAWFGEAFSQLPPYLQALHCGDGILAGKIRLNFGESLAGFVGKRLAKNSTSPSNRVSMN